MDLQTLIIPFTLQPGQVLYRALGEQPPGGPFSFAALLTNQTGAGEECEEEEDDEEWRQWEGSVTMGASAVEQEPPPPGEALTEAGPTTAAEAPSASGPQGGEQISCQEGEVLLPAHQTGDSGVIPDCPLGPGEEEAAPPPNPGELADGDLGVIQPRSPRAAEAGVEANASPAAAAADDDDDIVPQPFPIPETSAFVRISMEPAGPLEDVVPLTDQIVIADAVGGDMEGPKQQSETNNEEEARLRGL